jgi:RNA recognition motif-containing protein
VKFGRIKELALKYTFAFIDYEEHDSAVRAIREMDRVRFVNGETLLVEQSGMMMERKKGWSKGKKRHRHL